MYNNKDKYLEVLTLNRFKLISKEELTVEYREYHSVLKDTITNVLYYYISNGSGGVALTPLLDPDGKPLIDKSE